MIPSKLLLGTALIASSLAGYQGLSAQELTTRCDPPPRSFGRLTQAQKIAFMKSQDLFISRHYAEALGELRSLLSQLPENTPEQRAMAERTAEAAIEAGERTYVFSLLKPIEKRDSTDCPARTLLARAYAEDGKSAERDAEISALVELHKHVPKSPAGQLDAFLLEKHSLQDGVVVTTDYFLRPSGPHNTHILSQIFDASGTIILTVELDSDDPDQVDFKESHPQLAAKGDRRYSLDAFDAAAPP
jgi:hypothetical protein